MNAGINTFLRLDSGTGINTGIYTGKSPSTKNDLDTRTSSSKDASIGLTYIIINKNIRKLEIRREKKCKKT